MDQYTGVTVDYRQSLTSTVVCLCAFLLYVTKTPILLGLMVSIMRFLSPMFECMNQWLTIELSFFRKMVASRAYTYRNLAILQSTG